VKNMISVTRKSQMANLPWGKGRPMWTCGWLFDPCVMIDPMVSSENGSGNVPQAGVQNEQGEQTGQINEGSQHDATGPIYGHIAEKTEGLAQKSGTQHKGADEVNRAGGPAHRGQQAGGHQRQTVVGHLPSGLAAGRVENW